MGEEELVKETKIILKQLESIIINRDQSLEVCLWHTLESTLEILFIFTPKLIWQQADDNNNVSFHDHLITIVNASTLLSSVIRVILLKFDKNETAVMDALNAVDRLVEMIQRMEEFLVSHHGDYRLLITTHLHQVIKSLLSVFLTLEKKEEKKKNSIMMMTPPTTPDPSIESINALLSYYYQEKEEEEGYTYNQIVDEAYLSPCSAHYHQGGAKIIPTATRAKKSEKIKSDDNDTVGKKFMRSITSLKKNNQFGDKNALEYQQKARVIKTDKDKSAVEKDYNKANSNNKNSSLRIFFNNNNKRQPSNKVNTTRDIFEEEVSNEVSHGHTLNKRISVHQETMKSPFKTRNMAIHTTTTTATAAAAVAKSDLESSDSGCFTSTTNGYYKPIVQQQQQKSLVSIQKEHAEPIFVKKKDKQQQQQKSTAKQQQKKQTQNDNLHFILKPLQQLKRQPSQLSLLGKLYNINHDDEEVAQEEATEMLNKRGREGSILHVSENGQDVLVMEMIQANKLQVIAGTQERLFMKLADETCQDLDYVDTYILTHVFFINDEEELLENLMARFHLQSTCGETTAEKWQRCIQVKVLNVISRWIKLQFEDFKANPILITRLEAFLNGDVRRAGFTMEADMIKEALGRQRVQHGGRSRHSLIVQTCQSLVSFGNTNSTSSTASVTRRPSVTPSFLSFVSYSTTPPESPICTTLNDPKFLSMKSKDIAVYLTLADFLILKCITAQDLLYYPLKKKKSKKKEMNYIAMMTDRANKISKWVVEEINAHKLNSKPRRMTIRKMIEIAKMCLSWNNFHTCMVVTMGLTQLPEFRDNTWPTTLSNRDMTTLKHLLKYLNVCSNMSFYRQSFQKTAKAPCIPFFPIVLKDLTFLMDGNATIKDGLVNFTKFRILVQSIYKVLNYTIENYSFAAELAYFPFFPNQQQQGPVGVSGLDQVAAMIEDQIKHCYASSVQ